MFLANFELKDFYAPNNPIDIAFRVETEVGALIVGASATASLEWTQELPGNTMLEQKPKTKSVVLQECEPGYFSGVLKTNGPEGYYHVHILIMFEERSVTYTDTIIIETI